MAITNYYSLEGEIIGERTGVVRTDYSRDALGSVTATRTNVPAKDTYGATYRYKPYGERLAKTGTTPDPDFQWVGTAGYKETSISHSQSYVRARHYGQGVGSWTTTDYWWPKLARFTYAWGSPCDATDRDGRAPTLKIEEGIEGSFGPCGEMLVDWFATVTPKKYVGYVVQKVTRTYSVEKCPSGRKQPITENCPPRPPSGSTLTYYEAWKVRGGVLNPSIDDIFDLWKIANQGSCTHGSIKIEALAKLTTTLHKNYVLKSVSCAGPLLSTYNDPNWNNNGTQYRRKGTKWGCCALKGGCAKPEEQKCPPPDKCPDGPCFDTQIF